MINRYQIPELELLFSEKAKYIRWSLLEKEVFYALKNNNILQFDNSQLQKLEHLWDSIKITEIEVQEEEENTKHDFVAFLNVLENKLSNIPISKYLHYGLTSSDIIDSATSLLLKEVNNKLVKWVKRLQETLQNLAYKYLNTAQIGRTHGRHAEPISFGHKFAICYQELENALEQFYLSRRYVEVITIKGATGSFAHIGTEIQEDLANRLGLFTIWGTTQALPRNRHSSYLFSLSQIGKIVNSLAVKLRTLSREEISEISLEQAKYQVGSSAMPHKINPVSLENITGLSRWLTSLSNLAEQNIELWDERDISHSSNERSSLVDVPTLLGNIVLKMNDFLTKLSVNESKLNDNLSLTRGLIHSQIVSLALLEDPKISSRKEARRIISQITKDVREGKAGSLKLSISASNYKDSKAFSAITKAEDLNHYLQYFPRLYQQIFNQKTNLGESFNKYEIDNAIYYLAQRINWYFGSSPLQPNEKVIVIALLNSETGFSGKLIPSLNFPSIVIYIPYLDEELPLKLESSDFYHRILELSKKYSRLLIVKESVKEKEILSFFYSKLSPIESINEIKSVCLFFTPTNTQEQSIFNAEYYKTSTLSLDFSGSYEDKKIREFNFKNWTPNSDMQPVNWFGFLIFPN